ncbi:MAG: terminase gpA endonuclease subunit [Janthinobacterium lividum]
MEDIFIGLTTLLEPPEDITVSNAGEKYVYINNPGQHVGFFSNERSPYMVEPADTLVSRAVEAVIFVGPAQSSKTQSLILNWMAYTIKVDPADFMVYNPSQSIARDFSSRRVDRMLRESAVLKAELLPDRDADNVFDKHLRSGVTLNLSWPSKNTLAGRPLPKIALTDYDRMDDDIEGEGSAFDLAKKRNTTFKSFGMVLAESSPSREVEDPKWIKHSPHEAPPCKGIIALYNRGDRRKLYWPCPHCSKYFEGRWELLEWDKKATKSQSAKTVRMRCEYCPEKIAFTDRQSMLEWSVWLKDGQTVADDGRIVGACEQSRIASFWMNGTAAGFTTWENLVATYLDAMEDKERTGDDGALRKFFNTDIGVPFIPDRPDDELLPETLKSRAVVLPYIEPTGTDLADVTMMISRATPNDVVPIQPAIAADIRALIATVDVQRASYVVQVHGVSPGMPYELTVIDRFKISKSLRLDVSGERLPISPHAYLEDWRQIEMLVMARTYPLADGTGRRMQIKLTVCDSGGQEGVTAKAYEFQRLMRREGKSGRFHLVKGMHGPQVMRSLVQYPDSNQRGFNAVARGDVPVLYLGSNLLKDDLRGRLDSTEPGKGRFVFPNWLADFWFSEMTNEVRVKGQGWKNPGGRRNEAWDLAYYAIGACSSSLTGVERINWSNPPTWAEVHDKNDLVILAVGKEKFANKGIVGYDFSELGKKMG